MCAVLRVPFLRCSNNAEQLVEDADGPGHSGGLRVTESLQQVSDHGKVEVGAKAESHRVIKLLEMPFEWLTNVHDDLL